MGVLTHNGNVILAENGKALVGTGGPTGPVRWNEIVDKPFEDIGRTLSVTDGTLDVNISKTTNPEGGLTITIG